MIFAQVIKIHHTVYMGARCICNPATEFPDVNELKMNAKCKGALNDRHLSWNICPFLNTAPVESPCLSYEGHKYQIYRNVWDKFVSVLSIRCSFYTNLVVSANEFSQLHFWHISVAYFWSILVSLQYFSMEVDRAIFKLKAEMWSL